MKFFILAAILALAVLIVALYLIDVPVIETIECAGSAKCFNGTVTKITDGDTIEVDGVPIRLALVDAPESGEVGWNESREMASMICPMGTAAIVDEDDGQDESYGRIVAKVYCGEFDLNRMMIETGHATTYEEFCKVSEFSGESWTGC